MSTSATRSIAIRKREEELDVLLDGRVRVLDLVERRLAGEEVAVGLDRRDPVRDLAGLGRLPERDLAPVGGDRRRELRARALQRRRGGGRPAGVALAVRAAAELVRLRAARLAGLALRRGTCCS